MPPPRRNAMSTDQPDGLLEPAISLEPLTATLDLAEAYETPVRPTGWPCGSSPAQRRRADHADAPAPGRLDVGMFPAGSTPTHGDTDGQVVDIRTLGLVVPGASGPEDGSATKTIPTRRSQMFTQDLDATASYRSLARGSGCGWARAYQVSQQHHAGDRNPQHRDLRRSWRLSSTSEPTAKRVEQKHGALPRGDRLPL